MEKTLEKPTGKKPAAKREKAPSASVATHANGTSTFVFMDSTKNILDVAMATRKNVILYGKGGYGKSEFTEAYFREKGIEPFTLTMGSGMTSDRLFGGIDLPTFNTTGKIEYLIENSFMNHEYVVFEELFDAPDFILEQLKDILSSKVFRNGNQLFRIKTKLIVCCTNKTREEFAKNTSLKALMERFPLEMEVKWAQHNRHTYEKLLNTRLGHADPLLTFILEQYAVSSTVISPRIAIVAAEVIDQCGPDSLNFIADFAAKPDLLKGALSKFEGMIKLDKLRGTLEDLAREIQAIDVANTFDMHELRKASELLKKYSVTLIEFKGIKVEDSSVSSIAELTKRFDRFYESTKKTIELASQFDDDADVSSKSFFGNMSSAKKSSPFDDL